MRKTKIICTLGPATESAEVLHAMITAGANIFRLNMSHAPHDWVRMIVPRIRAIAKELQRGELTILQFEGLRTERSFYFIQRKGETSDLNKRFIKMARSIYNY